MYSHTLTLTKKTYKGHWVLHAYQVSSKSIKRVWRRSRKCKLSNGRRTTDDRQRTMRDYNKSLEPSAPVPKKKVKANVILKFLHTFILLCHRRSKFRKFQFFTKCMARRRGWIRQNVIRCLPCVFFSFVNRNQSFRTSVVFEDPNTSNFVITYATNSVKFQSDIDMKAINHHITVFLRIPQHCWIFVLSILLEYGSSTAI